MARRTFVNLPSRDLDRAVAFLTALGFVPDPTVSSADTRCVVISDGVSVMLHTETYFAQFTGSAVTDTATSRETAIGVSAVSRAEVDELTGRAVTAGGTDAGVQDLGLMYMRAFLDLDGHRWSLIHVEGSS